MMTDPVADMLTRIRNAQAVNKADVEMPCSRIKKAIANILKEEGYIKDFRISGTDKKPTLVVDMKYYQGVPVIDLLTRVSRPGLRVYRGNTELPKVCNGLGVAIISTPKGVVTDHKARSLGVGGEVLCYVA
jgi:small subunit ribosomal protein S8